VGGGELVVKGTEEGDTTLDPMSLWLGCWNLEREDEVCRMSGG